MIYFNKEPEHFQPRQEGGDCFMEYGGKILLLFRSKKGGVEVGTWCPPGGKMEPGETALEGIMREIFEETGIRMPPGSIRHVFRSFVRYPTFDFVWNTHHAALSELPNIILETEKHSDYCWVTPEEALRLPLIRDEDACIRRCYGLNSSSERASDSL